MSSSMVFVRARRLRRLKRLSGRSSFASRSMMLKKMENNVGGKDASLLDAVGDGESARQTPIVLHLTLLTSLSWRRMVRNFGGQPRRARIFDSPSQPAVSMILVRSTKAGYRPMFCSLNFSCTCLSTKIMSTVSLLDLNPH